MTRLAVGLLTCGVFVAAASAAQQGASGRTGTGEVSGIVRTDVSGAPAPRAMVLIAGTDVGLLRVTVTDAGGHFTFSALPPGRFLLGAGKPAYLAALYGAGRPGRPGEVITISGGQKVSDVALVLAKGGVIAGRVTDEHGQAVVGARVRVLPRRTVGEEIVLGADAGDPVNATTDDLGAYRIFDLVPADYVVAVQPRGLPGGPVRPTGTDFLPPSAQVPPPLRAGAPPPIGGRPTPPPIAPPPAPADARAGAPPDAGALLLTYASVYFPATSRAADAQVVHIAGGDEHTGVDLRTALVPLTRVEGVVAGAPGPQMNVQILLRPSGQDASGTVLNSQNIRPGPDGHFVFANVVPGAYDILARTLPSPNPPGGGPPAEAFAPLWALDRVTVAGTAPPPVSLRLQPALTLTGHVRFEGLSSPPHDLGYVRVGVRPTPASAIQNVPDVAVMDRAGNFTIANLTPGKYRLFVAIPPNNVTQVPDWFPRSALIAGRDALDLPVEIGPGASTLTVTITLTDDAPEVAGTVRDAHGKPAPDVTVIAFPSDPRFWFPQSRRIVVRQSDAKGAFVFGLGAGLPPGDYQLAALTDLGPGEQFDSNLLAELAKAGPRVVLLDGDSKTIDVRLVSAKPPR